MNRSALWVGVLVCLLAATLATPAYAETPIDQCTDSGSGAGQVPTVGTGMQPEPNFVTRPAVSATISLGTVNPRNGAFVYSNEDLSLGVGEFPARLGLVRTYSSDQEGPTGVGVIPNAPYMPGSIQWYAFGRGATHNLDIRFEINPQSFNGQVYQVVAIRTGFDTETFQQCLDGQYRNSRSNGSRLFADTTYGAGGFRYETRDGSILLFQKFVTASGVYSCGRMYGAPRICGVLRRWTAPNGDRAEFEYQSYYSHPTNRAENAISGGFITIWLYNAGTTECYPNFARQSECHSVAFPNYYSTMAQFYPAIHSFAVYEQRLTRVTNSRGYELLFTYVDGSVDAGGFCPADSAGSLLCVTPYKNTDLARNRLQSVVGRWISPTGQATQLGQVTYGYANCRGSNFDCLSSVQTSDGATTLFNWNSGLAIQLPGETTPSTTVTFTAAPHSYYYPDRERGWYTTNPRLTRNYYRVSTQAFSDASSVSYAVTFADRWVAEPYGMWARQPYAATMQITQAGGAVTTYNYVDTTDEHSGPVSVTDPLNRVTANTYSPVGALASTTLPDGRVIAYSYDVRGNLLSTTRNPRPGSIGLNPLVESFAYWVGPTVAASACTNQVLCNRPIRRTDARNAQTDYGWNSTTGLLTSVMQPADPSGQRPTITYAYQGFTGASSTSIQLLTSRTERLDATRNIVTNYSYGSNIRLPLREVSRTDGSTTLRTCLATDTNGNQISMTGPNANLGACP